MRVNFLYLVYMLVNKTVSAATNQPTNRNKREKTFIEVKKNLCLTPTCCYIMVVMASELRGVLSVASLTQLVIESVGRYQQEVATPPPHTTSVTVTSPPPPYQPPNRTSNNTSQPSEHR